MKILRIIAFFAASITMSSCLLIPDAFKANTGFTTYAEEEIEYTYGDLRYEIEDGYVIITDCDTSATEIEIPAKIEGKSVKVIGEQAFDYCQSLTSVTIPDTVIEIRERAFSRCDKLINVNIPKGITELSEKLFSECKSLESIEIPDNVTSICYGAFEECESLKKINVPNKVTSISGGLFSGCTNLTSIIIPNGVTTIGSGAFYGCESLTSISIPDSVTCIESVAFKNCTNLENIELPNTIESVGYDVFLGTKWYDKITSDDPLIIINNTVVDGKNCTGNVVIPDGVTSIVKNAFSECTMLTGIEFPDTLTSIGEYAFYGCTALKEIKIPDTLNVIENGTFSKCTSLKSLTIPYPVEIINERAFEICTDLASVTIPRSVKTIAREAFSGCSKLSNVTFKSQVDRIDKDAFKETALVKETSDGYYFDGTYEKFKTYGGAIAFDLMGKIITFNDDSFVEEPPLYIYLTDEGTFGVSGYFGNDKDGLVIVPDEIDNIPVTDIPSYGFWWSGPGNSNYFSTIILGKNIKNIAEHAFINPEKVLVDSKNPYFCTKNDALFTADMTELIFFPSDYRKDEYTVPSTMKKIRSFAFTAARVHTLNIISKEIRIENLAFDQGCSISVINIESENVIFEEFVFYDNYCLMKLKINGNITYDFPPLSGEELSHADFFYLQGGHNCEIFGQKNSDAEKFAKIVDRPFYEAGSEDDYEIYKTYYYIAALYKDHAQFIGLTSWDNDSDITFHVPETIEDLPVTSVRESAFNNGIYHGFGHPKHIYFHSDISYIGDLNFLTDSIIIENPDCVIGEISERDSMIVYCPENAIFKDELIENGYTVLPLYKYPGQLKGDANLDGKISIADAVMLQKWLLGASKELTCWENVDLCKDNKIDVFDLCLLRRKLIEKDGA